MALAAMAIVGAQQSYLTQTLPPLLTNSQVSLTPIEGSEPGNEFVSDGAAQQVSSPLVIDAPVRSGQSILHQGDITVFGSVSSGAEIVATGSIHIYGTLRGSIMAGADGNAKAHIYCQRLEAELLSINGYYSTADGIEPHLMGSAVHARLQDCTLEIRALN